MMHRGGRAPPGRRFHGGRVLAAGVLSLAAALAVTGCVSITTKPRALLLRDDGSVQVQTLACPRQIERVLAYHATSDHPGLNPRAIHVLSWNIHKQSDPGWQRDLRRLGERTDLVLLQETVLDPPLRDVIDAEGFRWVMASSFLTAGTDIGVLTASRTQALATCTERAVEPLLRIPKSAVISWFPLAGRQETLAVVNVHAINFSLSLGAYRAQFRAIGDALERHRGPIIVAGDLNTWNDRRLAAVRELAQRLRLSEVRFAADRRSQFLGHELDHIYTRDLATLAATATAVSSSDHNPVTATLRLAQ
jgi:endonuclease/exonuclease/phosphatase (EEP) superfamily protein YafD